jgi:sarcosine oxidase
MKRRDFLKTTGLGAGALAAGAAGAAGAAARILPPDTPLPTGPLSRGFRSGTGPDVVVVGAGAFGGWTALNLQEMGARVTLVDMYGPGNSRSTSGDETRGVRTSYAGRELWTSWAARSIERWKAFDAEFAASMGGELFFTTGDLIFRDTEIGMIEQVREIWDWAGVPYENLDADEVHRRWPQIAATDMSHVLFEPGAGVVRARAATQRVAALFQARGGEIRIGRAEPGRSEAGRLHDITLNGDGGERIAADRFVFALGPWFSTTFQDVLSGVFRIPMGNVMYYGTPPGDERFNFPNIPSWNFPGVTGWPSLPPDHRGFRVRAGGQAGGDDPDTSVRWVGPEGLDRPRSILAERFPALAEQPLVETRACHYESNVMREWLIDLHPDYGNLWFAGGGNAEGFKFGPTVGELIAARVLGDARFAELDDEFRMPDREAFGLP